MLEFQDKINTVCFTCTILSHTGHISVNIVSFINCCIIAFDKTCFIRYKGEIAVNIVSFINCCIIAVDKTYFTRYKGELIVNIVSFINCCIIAFDKTYFTRYKGEITPKRFFSLTAKYHFTNVYNLN